MAAAAAPTKTLIWAQLDSFYLLLLELANAGRRIASGCDNEWASENPSSNQFQVHLPRLSGPIFGGRLPMIELWRSSEQSRCGCRPQAHLVAQAAIVLSAGEPRLSLLSRASSSSSSGETNKQTGGQVSRRSADGREAKLLFLGFLDS